VLYDKKQVGYFIAPHFTLKLSPLTNDELLTLLLAAHAWSSVGGEELVGIVRQSISKILAQAPAQVREEAASLLKSCVADSPRGSSANGEREVRSQIIMAIRRKRQIRIHYCTSGETGQLKQTKIAPYRLVMSPEAWRLVGRSSVHRRVCFFDLERIHRVEMLEDTYDLPAKMPSLKSLFGSHSG